MAREAGTSRGGGVPPAGLAWGAGLAREARNQSTRQDYPGSSPARLKVARVGKATPASRSASYEQVGVRYTSSWYIPPMAKAYNVKKEYLEDGLTGDDSEDIRRLTGALWDGDEEFRRRKKGVLPERRCRPWAKRDAEMTERFRRAVELQSGSPAFESMMECEQNELRTVVDLIEIGSIKTLDDVPEELLLRFLLLKVADSRHSSTQLRALDTLMKAKGMLGARKIEKSELLQMIEGTLSDAQDRADDKARARRENLKRVKGDGTLG